MMKQRILLRYLHLLGGAIIGTYVYSPWHHVDWFVLLNQVIVAPLLTLSGLWMWQGHKIRKLIKQ